MNNLSILYVWPFLVLALGLVFVAFGDLWPRSGAAGTFLTLAVIGLLLSVFTSQSGKSSDNLAQAKALRRNMVTLTLAALVPVFVRYMLESFDRALPVVILGLFIGFGLVLWGLFVDGNKVLLYANVIGGGLVIVYVYFQLWDLGELARVIAAAFGLVVAVTVSAIKLKDKLT